MSEVYKIEVARWYEGEFTEVGIFSKRGARVYLRAHLAEAEAKNKYIAPSMFAPLRVKSGREVAEWLERLPYFAPWELRLYGERAERRQEVERFRITCYAIKS